MWRFYQNKSLIINSINARKSILRNVKTHSNIKLIYAIKRILFLFNYWSSFFFLFLLDFFIIMAYLLNRILSGGVPYKIDSSFTIPRRNPYSLIPFTQIKIIATINYFESSYIEWRITHIIWQFLTPCLRKDF